MKFASMNPRDRRALALLAVIAIPGLLFPLAVKPYLNTLAGVREQTDAERARIATERRAIADLPKLPMLRVHASQQLNGEIDRLFQSTDDLAAASNLAQYVAGAAQDAGLSLQQSETRPSHAVTTGVQALQVDVRAEGDLDGILHFLHQLEAGGKLVRVGSLSIEAHEQITAQSQPQSRATEARSIFQAAARFDRRFRKMQVPDQDQGQGQGQSQEDGQSQGPGQGQPDDANRLQGAEVLSLTASVYGYCLTGAPWSTMNTQGKGAPSQFPRSAVDFESLDALVDHDLFSATRSRPAIAYRTTLTGNPQDHQDEQRARQIEMRIARFILQVVGTVVAPGQDAFAMVKSSNRDDPPLMLHVGENINGYTLVSVRQGSAVFTTPHGIRLEKQLLEPGASQ